MVRKSIHYIAKSLSVFSRNEDGATAIEYGLFAALIAAVLVVIVGNLGVVVQTKFANVCTALDSTGNCAVQ
ncbi:Flp family type IVb pilin [Solirhodobacter olei]|uniref:Flp family type IVb pilin n=1 Tax=Solirhodobacter olei TaxID=2493082 RepID=UPI0019D43E54|nr:Flp family type IVb pilin [Solirhodobacter olei]